MWLQRLFRNHVLSTLAFVLVMVTGALSYQQMPRAKDPEINFNWINIITLLPGGSAEDIEKKLTDPLEDAIQSSVNDVRFVTSTSREGVSNILVRFQQIDSDTFDKRVTDLRREVLNTYNDELPEEAKTPFVYEVTTSNAYPAATVVVTSLSDDENLRRQARNTRKDLERMPGVEGVTTLGFAEPEIHVEFHPDRLQGLGITPADVADTVRAYFRDISAGSVTVDNREWLVRLVGTAADPGVLAELPVTAAGTVVKLGDIARLTRTTEETQELVRYDGQPGVLLAVMKSGGANVLELLARIKAYIDERNTMESATGVRLVLVDDQTVSTRKAISIMETNAMFGFFMVLIMTWVFLGSRLSLLTTLGIPFALAGTFLLLNAMGMTLNNSVLLGVVIALGMLVDDAVVVVEAIYVRLQRGMNGLQASIEALQEVFAPVCSSVLTTVAAFLPLMLMPGILGEFMKVIPIVVSLALLISLLEAFWMLPSHISWLGDRAFRRSRVHRLRWAFTHWLQVRYSRLLVSMMRHTWLALLVFSMPFVLAVGAVATGHVRLDFFAADPFRLFYIRVEMPPGTTLQKTIAATRDVEERIAPLFRDGELRARVAYAGQIFTELEPLFGDHYGQIQVSLNPRQDGMREVDEVIAAVRPALSGIVGPVGVTITRLADGPPVTRPISIKVRGDEYPEILAATERLKSILSGIDAVSNVTTDFVPGTEEMVLRLRGDAVQRSGLDPSEVMRAVTLLVDGEIVADVQDQGEKVEVRVRQARRSISDIRGLLNETISLRDGRTVPLSELVEVETGVGKGNIRHYNFRRAVTVESDLDKESLNTVQANRRVQEEWSKLAGEFPDISLDFSGELDDINESIDAIKLLFLFGVGLIYVILGTQFRSYLQPFLVLSTVPMAFTGVVLGLLITRDALSLYTLYGVVALAGIAVNSAIVLISAANDRLAAGMSVIHATIYAARRRLIAVLVTSLTTIAGLLSLAMGWGGYSKIWGPVGNAIVWGLGFSTLLTLFVIPLIYRIYVGSFRPLLRRVPWLRHGGGAQRASA